ncbi:MAG TPA: agmatinase [Spirochaetia bacterium]|nr:agmatinase [Spirochaetia bacterium]
MSGAFLGLEPRWSSRSESRFAVIKVPFDGTSTWIKGADRGPGAIIDASAHLELYDIETDSEPYRAGIYTRDEDVTADTVDEMVLEVEKAVADVFAQRGIPILLGGEHSVTIGAVRAARSAFPALSVLQLDAHTDLREEYEGSANNHACVMARVLELCPAVQVGIRSMDASEKPSLRKGQVFFARDIMHDIAWMERVVEGLSDEVYITFDLDVLDPSIMPATGTPEPGGLLWYDCLRLLRKVARQKRIVGFDVVELCPGVDHAPPFLASKLIYKIIGYICAGEHR